jgi:hypothetical protein
MELFHIHLLGNKDRMYRPNGEIMVDPERFNNRLFNRIYDANVCVSGDMYDPIIKDINKALHDNAGLTLGDQVNIGEILNYALYQRGLSRDELIKVLQDTSDIMLKTGTNYRELAMEEFRKNNCPDKPSRLHSLYACNEEGLRFWLGQIHDGESDIYRIDVEQEPFVTNEELLPAESLSYGNKIQASYKYFNPKKKDLNGVTDEYLVQGRVKLLEKIGEVRAR